MSELFALELCYVHFNQTSHVLILQTHVTGMGFVSVNVEFFTVLSVSATSPVTIEQFEMKPQTNHLESSISLARFNEPSICHKYHIVCISLM